MFGRLLFNARKTGGTLLRRQVGGSKYFGVGNAGGLRFGQALYYSVKVNGASVKEDYFEAPEASDAEGLSTYLETMWQAWQKDRSSVNASLAAFFAEEAAQPLVSTGNVQGGQATSTSPVGVGFGNAREAILDHLKVQRLVRKLSCVDSLMRLCGHVICFLMHDQIFK